jgi:hypothetical protein
VKQGKLFIDDFDSFFDNFDIMAGVFVGLDALVAQGFDPTSHADVRDVLSGMSET